VICPEVHNLAGKFRAIVAEQHLRPTSLRPDLVESTHDILALQPLTYLDGQAFASKYIQNCQGAEPPAIGQLISHEIKTPGLVGFGWTEPFTPMLRCSTPLSRNVSQR
jgi:hypothetical protein